MFFPSGPDRLYASLYASDPPEGSGVVICPSWGVDMIRRQGLAHAVARDLAESGGAGFVFHWPGHGDSEGLPEAATLPRLGEAAVDAVAAARRMIDANWDLVGIGAGAHPATEAAARLGLPMLLLLQPAVDLAAHLSRVQRAAVDRADGEASPGWAFGHPLPEGVRLSATASDLGQAISRVRGRTGVIRYTSPEPEPGPPGVEVLTVPGDWRREAALGHPSLAAAAIAWLAGGGGRS
jgi:alpha-beta hydrolase superfamily lysophospholipase